MQQAADLSFSIEGEYASVVLAGKHVALMQMILDELGLPQRTPSPLFCDNQSTF
jgi:hypothetical protein